MKFINIFKQCDEQTRKALLSMWAPGHHPMREYLRQTFEREPLMAEPIFQSAFGWEKVTDDKWKDLFSGDFLDKMQLDEDYTPYTHQRTAWKSAIKKGKSIVVTSGTGSGKTQCFTFPVLNDLYEERIRVKRKTGNQEAEPDFIQALFLYPLNALMEDQKEELGKKCELLKIKFGVYNGATPHFKAIGDSTFKEEARTREEIRKTKTPQILLTNPSMLEYMIVRDTDQKLLEKSKGHLRWIIIDEAHSYSGSSAIELSYQIKRILEAFEVDINNVRFACTSATIGGHDSESKLRSFISTLTGKDEKDIEIIGGNRLVPPIDDMARLQQLLDSENLPFKAANVMNLRTHINETTALTAKEIWQIVNGSTNDYSLEHTLEVIDKLCEVRLDDDSFLLYTRIHLFMRAIQGIYGCPNPECPHHGDTPYGFITTNAGTVCPHCNTPLFEMVKCNNCGDFLLLGEKAGSGVIRQLENFRTDYNPFAVDDLDDDNEQDNNLSIEDSQWEQIKIRPYYPGHHHPKGNTTSVFYKVGTDGDRISLVSVRESEGPVWMAEKATGQNDHHECICPECGKKASRQFHPFRVPINLLNPVVAPILLKESDAKEPQAPWAKYITFTDSRQGTAISTKRFNVENEKSHSSSAILEKIIEKNWYHTRTAGSGNEQNIINAQIQYVRRKMDERPEMNEFYQLEITDLEQQLAALPATGAYQSISHYLKIFEDTIADENLYEHYEMNENDRGGLHNGYQHALLRTILGRRPINKNSMESMGLVSLVYPGLERINAENSLAVKEWNKDHTDNQISDQDWRDFLKICLDYFIRFNNHIQYMTNDEVRFVRDGNYSTPVFSKDDASHEKKWTDVNLEKEKDNDGHQHASEEQPRLVLLLCAGLHIFDTASLDGELSYIQNLITQAWLDLTTAPEHEMPILTQVTANGRGYDDEHIRKRGYVGGYYLDMSFDSTTVKVRQADKAWLCPVSKRVIDTLFKGYSPSIGSGNGYLNQNYIDRYRVEGENEDKSFMLPMLQSIDRQDIASWLVTDDRVAELKNRGAWSDILDRIYEGINNRTYIAAEHSAQQSRSRLQRYVGEFVNGTLNVLNCSTTMEMGVNIGTIDIVVMDTVPPASANYLQRAGRAGRKGQSKAVAFTFCNGTPIALKAFKNPMSLVSNTNTMTLVKPTQIITQRHANSFFLKKFINYQMSNGGIMAMFTMKDFFDDGTPTLYENFKTYLDNPQVRTQLEKDFNKCFGGTDMKFSMIEQTKEKIKVIYEKYHQYVEELNMQYEYFSDDDHLDEKRARAIMYQIERLQKEKLLGYLSQNLFIPNANMPTGVVEFSFIDDRTSRDIHKLYKEINDLKDSLPNLTDVEKKSKRIEISEKYAEIDDIRSDHTAQRDIHTALNEYAPEQTVVINERNYKVAGIRIYGDYDAQTQQRYIYHCTKCGNTVLDYSEPQDGERRTCPKCQSEFSSIIKCDKDHSCFARAWEPIGFRTDESEQADGQENEKKKFYEIRAELIGMDWQNPPSIGLCEISGSLDGNIIYYNIGAGRGFAICRCCGRAAVEGFSKDIPAVFNHTNVDENGAVRRWHKALWGGDCNSGVNDIKRHVVLTAEHHTVYTAMRFYKSYDDYVFIADESTVYSLGVVIKQALVKILGIDENEVSFDTKQDDNSYVLFIYDTNKGGSGYANYLQDPTQCSQVLDEALHILQESGCDCETKTAGACTKCLVNRESMHHIHLLSKNSALVWLLRQKGLGKPISDEIKAFSENAECSRKELYYVAYNAISSPEVKEVCFFVDGKNVPDNSDETSWSGWESGMGNLLHQLAQNGKEVNINVYYAPDSNQGIEQMLDWLSLQDRLSKFNVKGVTTKEKYATALVIKTDSGIRRYFTTEPEKLVFTNDWGKGMTDLYVDMKEPVLDSSPLPGIQSIIQLMGSGVMFKEGMVRMNYIKASQLWTLCVKPALGLSEKDFQAIKEAFHGKEVNLTYSDAYLNSALSIIITASFIKQIRDDLGFTIKNLNIIYDQKYFKGENEKTDAYEKDDYEVEISKNFLYCKDRNKYLRDTMTEIIGKRPSTPSANGVEHHRYLSISVVNGTAKLDIRPDRGLASGWVTCRNVCYDKIELVGENVDIRKKNINIDMLYYLIFNK